MSIRDWVLLMTLAVLWGGSFFFVELVVNVLPPITIVTIRVGMAALVLLGFCILTNRDLFQILRFWWVFALMSLLNNIIPFTLIVWGQTQISSSLASVLNATTPLFSLIMAHLFTVDEKLNVRKLVGVGIGFLGVVVLILPNLLGGFDGTVFGQIAVLSAAISYSVASVFGRRFGKLGLDPIVTATGQLVLSSLILFPMAMVLDSPWDPSVFDIQTLLALTGLAIFSTALAYIIYFKLLISAGSVNLMLVTFLIPAVAIVLGVFLLSESMSIAQITGMLVLFVGLIVIDGRILQHGWKGTRK